MPNSCMLLLCSMPSQIFVDDHYGTSSQAIFSSHGNKHGNCLQLLFLLGLLGGASSSEALPDSMDHSNWYPKLEPFFPSSFNCNFQTNDDQRFIVYKKSTLILFRKGLCVFSVSGYALEEKLCGVICHKF